MDRLETRAAIARACLERHCFNLDYLLWRNDQVITYRSLCQHIRRCHQCQTALLEWPDFAHTGL